MTRVKYLSRSVFSKVCVISAFELICVATPRVAHAQLEGMNFQIGPLIQEMLERQKKRSVGMTPAIVNVNTSEKTATIEFINRSTDTLIATIEVGNRAAVSLAPPSTTSDAAGGLLADDEPSSKANEVDPKWSLGSWVKDLPEKIVLPPLTNKTITIKLDVPATASDGEYSAWIVATTQQKENSSEAKGVIKGDGLTVDFGKGGLQMQSSTKLVYRVTGAKK